MTTRVIEVIEQGPVGPPGDTTAFPFSKPGFLLAPYDTPYRFYVPFNCTVDSVQVSVGTPPSGASIILDILKNGTSIYSGGVGRPTIAVAANRGVGGTPSSPVFSNTNNDYLTVRISQVGSINPGADLLVLISLKRSQ